jgi:hypothetical protein
MKKTLQDQYLLIKEGKGHVGVFLTEAKRQFPNIVRNAATFDEAVSSLKTKNIISENVFSVMPAIMGRPKKESYETAFEAFLAEARKKKENEDEKVKAEEKKVSKPVEEDLSHNYDNSDKKNPDNMIFDQIMTGYYAEMKDPKNADKTMQELKDIVFKNLEKDPIYYTKNGQFGVKDLGYVTEAPGLGEPKEPKGKYKSSGYGDLKESQMYYTDEDDEDESDIVSKLMQMGVSPLVIDSIRKTKGIEGLKDRLREKDVRDMSWTKGFTKEEQILRKAIRELINSELNEMVQSSNVEPLRESVEKEIAEINKMAEYEVLESKLQKLADAIEKRQSQLGKLDEDEDMKALTDKKKLKDLQKDIKTLEKAKTKLEKVMSKHKGKVKKTEVIDEVEDEFDISQEYERDADKRQDDGQKIDSIVSTYTNIPSDESDDLKDYLEDREDNY